MLFQRICVSKTNSLQVEEAALTGESVASEKDTNTINDEAGVGDRTNMVFSSTNVTYGRGLGVVTRHGDGYRSWPYCYILDEAEAFKKHPCKKTKMKQ